LRVSFPAKLANVFAVAFESELAPLWNGLLVRAPEKVKNRRALYSIHNSQVSLLGGMFKCDSLDEMRRFVDIEAGMLVENMTPVKKGHPDYREPAKGFKRTHTKLKNIWIACGPDRTVLLQAGSVEMPFQLSKWLVSTVGGIAGRQVLGTLVRDALRSTKPNNPWEKALSKDCFGVYAQLDQCVNSPASLKRATSSQDLQMGEFFAQRVLNLSEPSISI